MANKGKRYQEAAALIEKGKAYPIEEAVALVKKTSNVKFDASVDVVFKLGLDTNMQINNYVGQLYYHTELEKQKKY